MATVAVKGFRVVAERQSARMSKITNGGLTRSGTGCFIAALQRPVNVMVKRVNAALVA